jgi:hypothetical protein
MENSILEVFAMTTGDKNCAGGKCPTIYSNKDGRYFVQGYNVSNEVKSQLGLAENENLVEINMSLLRDAINKIDRGLL